MLTQQLDDSRRGERIYFISRRRFNCPEFYLLKTLPAPRVSSAGFNDFLIRIYEITNYSLVSLFEGSLKINCSDIFRTTLRHTRATHAAARR